MIKYFGLSYENFKFWRLKSFRCHDQKLQKSQNFANQKNRKKSFKMIKKVRELIYKIPLGQLGHCGQARACQKQLGRLSWTLHLIPSQLPMFCLAWAGRTPTPLSSFTCVLLILSSNSVGELLACRGDTKVATARLLTLNFNTSRRARAA